MAVQQRKRSKQIIRQRKAANRYEGIETGKCSNCGAAAMPHRMCPACGTYKGKTVVEKDAE